MAGRKNSRSSKTDHVLSLLAGAGAGDGAQTATVRPEAAEPAVKPDTTAAPTAEKAAQTAGDHATAAQRRKRGGTKAQEQPAAGTAGRPAQSQQRRVVPPILEVARQNNEALSETIREALSENLEQELAQEARNDAGTEVPASLPEEGKAASTPAEETPEAKDVPLPPPEEAPERKEVSASEAPQEEIGQAETAEASLQPEETQPVHLEEAISASGTETSAAAPENQEETAWAPEFADAPAPGDVVHPDASPVSGPAAQETAPAPETAAPGFSQPITAAQPSTTPVPQPEETPAPVSEDRQEIAPASKTTPGHAPESIIPTATSPTPALEAAAPTAESPDRDQLPDGSVFLNVMELLVEERIEKYVKLFGLCSCPRCMADVRALALTRLPAKYVVLPRSARAPMLSMYQAKLDTTVIAQVIQACKTVMENPRHQL